MDGPGTIDVMASALTRLKKIRREIESRPQVIDDARREGETWEVIAEALGMSRYGAIKLHSTLNRDPG